MRASHADREQVIGLLKTAFVQGRLAKDEFDLRVGRGARFTDLWRPQRPHRRHPRRVDKSPIAGPGPETG